PPLTVAQAYHVATATAAAKPAKKHDRNLPKVPLHTRDTNRSEASRKKKREKAAEEKKKAKKERKKGKKGKRSKKGHSSEDEDDEELVPFNFQVAESIDTKPQRTVVTVEVSLTAPMSELLARGSVQLT
ncbi:hypothetical protein HDU98_005818, partial [Podochytrium sp. JEL0797]